MEHKDLLTKLLSFYSARYNGKSLETKFNDAVYELVKSDDVKISDYIIFCIDNNIEPTVKEQIEIETAPDLNMFGTMDDDYHDYDDFFIDMTGDAIRRQQEVEDARVRIRRDSDRMIFGLGDDHWEF